MAKYHLGKARLQPMQPAAFPPTVCDLWGGPQGIRRALLSQLFPLISLVNCTAHASESLWIVMLPLLPPFWFAGLSASIRTGKLFPMISFSPMVPVSGRFSGWFPLLGLPWIPPFSIWHLALRQPFRPQFPRSPICWFPVTPGT